MKFQDSLIVLRTLRYSDDRLIVEALSRTHGRVSLIVRITHSPRAAVRHTLFTPLAVVEAEWDTPRTGQLGKPTSARVAQPRLTLHTVPEKTVVVLFLAEVLLHVVHSEQADERMFDYVAAALQWLDTAEKDYANFHLAFLMRLTLFLGIAPDLSEPSLPYFDLMAGRYAAVRPMHAHVVEGEEAAAPATLSRMDFATLRLFKFTRAQRNRILDMIIDYYRLHLAAMPELKSTEVLRTLFDAPTRH